MAALKYLEHQSAVQPELAEWYTALAGLYERRLWHQLTLKLEQFVTLRGIQAGDTLIELYHKFISEFETKINLLKLAHFSVIVSRQYEEGRLAVKFLEGVIQKLGDARERRLEDPSDRFRTSKDRRIEEAILYVRMQIAALKLRQGDQKECKTLLEAGKTTLESMTDVDPTVHASVHWVSSQFHKSLQEFADFYKSALLYLAYTSVDTLDEDFKLDLAFDLSLAALLGDHIYNFGELLSHPIVKSMLGTDSEWLYFILQAFNEGNLIKYQEYRRKYNAALIAQPALVENENKLWEKINILCLMELIFSRPSEERTIPLGTIAERTKLSPDDVEHLLIKSLSVHLIEGVIDQVDGTIRVSWVQPRVLGIPQVTALRDRLGAWLQKVHTTLIAVEAETPDLVSA